MQHFSVLRYVTNWTLRSWSQVGNYYLSTIYNESFIQSLLVLTIKQESSANSWSLWLNRCEITLFWIITVLCWSMIIDSSLVNNRKMPIRPISVTFFLHRSHVPGICRIQSVEYACPQKTFSTRVNFFFFNALLFFFSTSVSSQLNKEPIIVRCCFSKLLKKETQSYTVVKTE